jgi:hypothetical protein
MADGFFFRLVFRYRRIIANQHAAQQLQLGHRKFLKCENLKFPGAIWLYQGREAPFELRQTSEEQIHLAPPGMSIAHPTLFGETRVFRLLLCSFRAIRRDV